MITFNFSKIPAGVIRRGAGPKLCNLQRSGGRRFQEQVGSWPLARIATDLAVAAVRAVGAVDGAWRGNRSATARHGGARNVP